MRADGQGCFVNQSTEFCLIAEKGGRLQIEAPGEPKSFCYICINRYITQCGLIRFPLKINYNLSCLIRRTTSSSVYIFYGVMQTVHNIPINIIDLCEYVGWYTRSSIVIIRTTVDELTWNRYTKIFKR
ncbi:hypothetical protein GHT06_014895 [Daphnia sinensis]|uniref:Uncharacterized protein n=1 Tax=Daphnia sinensis TaxID=1820382 RepID=A0AAD5KSJ0_9CRUS|nr:hypothetical protein GHT06_014895 [Daphnia sinensis]